MAPLLPVSTPRRTPDKPLRTSSGLASSFWVNSSRRSRYLAGALLLISLGCLVWNRISYNVIVEILVAVLDWARALGAWSVPMIVLCEAFAFLLLIPISPLHVGMGFLYGPYCGAALAWFAYCIGCVPPFLLARIPMLAERINQIRRRTDVLDGVFSAVESEPFKLIVCLRLSPMLPSTLNSYLLGLTNVRLRTYISASLVGSLPNVCAYVYLGTLLDSLADIASGRIKRSPLSYVLMLTGVVATIAVMVYVSRAATRRVQIARSKSGGSGSASSPVTGGRGSGVT